MVVAKSILALAQHSGIARASRRAPCLLEFSVGIVREPHHQLAELLAEFVLFSQKLQGTAFDSQGRIENHVPVSHKHRARHLTLHRRHETHIARVQVERGGVTLQREFVDRNHFAAQSRVAQLLIGWVRIRRGGCGILCEQASDRKQGQGKMQNARRRWHGASSQKFWGPGKSRKQKTKNVTLSTESGEKQGFLPEEKAGAGLTSPADFAWIRAN